jgi:hypothetical protein
MPLEAAKLAHSANAPETIGLDARLWSHRAVPRIPDFTLPSALGQRTVRREGRGRSEDLHRRPADGPDGSGCIGYHVECRGRQGGRPLCVPQRLQHQICCRGHPDGPSGGGDRGEEAGDPGPRAGRRVGLRARSAGSSVPDGTGYPPWSAPPSTDQRGPPRRTGSPSSGRSTPPRSCSRIDKHDLLHQRSSGCLRRAGPRTGSSRSTRPRSGRPRHHGQNARSPSTVSVSGPSTG